MLPPPPAPHLTVAMLPSPLMASTVSTSLTAAVFVGKFIVLSVIVREFTNVAFSRSAVI